MQLFFQLLFNLNSIPCQILFRPFLLLLLLILLVECSFIVCAAPSFYSFPFPPSFPSPPTSSSSRGIKLAVLAFKALINIIPTTFSSFTRQPSLVLVNPVLICVRHQPFIQALLLPVAVKVPFIHNDEGFWEPFSSALLVYTTQSHRLIFHSTGSTLSSPTQHG